MELSRFRFSDDRLVEESAETLIAASAEPKF
jgi:hypothetical protein